MKIRSIFTALDGAHLDGSVFGMRDLHSKQRTKTSTKDKAVPLSKRSRKARGTENAERRQSRSGPRV